MRALILIIIVILFAGCRVEPVDDAGVEECSAPGGGLRICCCDYTADTSLCFFNTSYEGELIYWDDRFVEGNADEATELLLDEDPCNVQTDYVCERHC